MLIKSKKALALAVLMLLSLNIDAQTNGLDIKMPDGVYVVVSHPGELKSKIPEKMVQAIRRMNLKEVTVFWPTPPKTKNLANTKSTVLRVPSGSEELYKKDKGWKKFKQIEGF